MYMLVGVDGDDNGNGDEAGGGTKPRAGHLGVSAHGIGTLRVAVGLFGGHVICIHRIGIHVYVYGIVYSYKLTMDDSLL